MSVYDIPDGFNDNSDISIHYIQISEGNNKTQPKGDILVQIGFGITLIAVAVIFITGLVSIFKWILN